MTIPVEVKCLDTTAYYNALVRDVDKKGRLYVEYERKFKPDQWVEAKYVRRPAVPHVAALFNPQPNDYVEAMAKCGEGEPCGWWRAKIIGLKAQFYIITYTAWQESKEVAEKDILRPTNVQPSLKPEDLKVVTIDVPSELRGRGSLQLDRLQSLLTVGGSLGCIYQEEKRQLLIVGPPAIAKNSQLVAELHIKQQKELAALERKRRAIEEEEEMLRAQMKDCLMIDFTVDPNLVGLVIGKSGANMKAAERIPGVRTISVTSETGHIRIFSTTQDAANQARAILEYVEERYPVLRSQVGRIVGKNFSNIHTIEKLSEVVRIRVDDEREKEATAAPAGPPRLSNLKETGKKEQPKRSRPQSAPISASSSSMSWGDMTDDFDGNRDIINLLIVGTAANVQRARTHLDAHMEHLRKLSLMVDEEKGAATRLQQLANHAGINQHNRNRPRTAGGNRGDRSDRGDRDGERKSKKDNANGAKRGGENGKREGGKKEGAKKEGGNKESGKKESPKKAKKETNGNGATGAATKESGKKEAAKGEGKRAAKKEGDKQQQPKKEKAEKKEKKDKPTAAATTATADGDATAAAPKAKAEKKKKNKEAAKKDGAAATAGEGKDGEAKEPSKPRGERPKKNKPVPAVRPGSEAAQKREAAAATAAAATNGDKKHETPTAAAATTTATATAAAAASSPTAAAATANTDAAAAAPASPSSGGNKKRERATRHAAGNDATTGDDNKTNADGKSADATPAVVAKPE